MARSVFQKAWSAVKAWSYAFNRRLLDLLIEPACVDQDRVPDSPVETVYVLRTRALTDLLALDLVTRRERLPRPTAVLFDDEKRQRRVLCLNRSSAWLIGRHTMQRMSPGLTRLLERSAADDTTAECVLVPVSTFWGRIPHRERSILRLLVSEQWTTTSRLRRLFTIVFNRRDVLVRFGEPLELNDLTAGGDPTPQLARRAARLLRRRFSNQRRATLGPDLSHQRTLVTQITGARPVQAVINEQVSSGGERDRTRLQARLQARARRAAQGIASNMSYTTIRLFDRLLRLLWTRIYDGVELNGIERVQAIAEENTLVYVPCHRSHVDYLLLSYLLYHQGLSLPHIAAGDNLNLPIVGPLLRRGGAFFMRRSFRDDPLYAAVFAEYLYRVYRRGHSVEFFIEGGRTRTGRLLPPQLGLLSMTLAHHRRGLPKPLVFVPVYFGYERLIEARSYMAELRGARKRRESLLGVVRSIRVLRQSFGRVTVNIGQPLPLQAFLDGQAGVPDADLPEKLGRELSQRINAAAQVTPLNLVAAITLSTPRIALGEAQLREQLSALLALLNNPPPGADYRVDDKSAPAMIEYAERLHMLDRESLPDGDILSHAPDTAVLMTWYRNNILHLLALPSLIACLLYQRQRPLARATLQQMVAAVYPYLARELMLGDAGVSAIDHWVSALRRERLICVRADGSLLPPADDSPERFRLQLTARPVLQSLERLYIVAAALNASGSAGLPRRTLESRCADVARRMSRLYGLNAPEFFDRRLIGQFIEQLLARGAAHRNEHDHLVAGDIIRKALRIASRVLDDDFRSAVLRQQAPEPEPAAAAIAAG